MLTFGSLFAGIGGFDLGFERAGMKCLWQVEIDEYANRILAKHWPDVPRFRDVTKFCRRAYDCLPENEFGEVVCPRCGVEFGECDCIGTDQLIDEIGAVDVICGGFPCQDISNAGRRAGLDGDRSGLFFEIIRIAGELRPRFIVLENVSALLNRGFDRVLGELAAIGFDAEWHCIPASAVGAPHQRDRVWIIAYVADAECGRVSLRRRIKTSGQNDYELQRIPCDDSQSSALEKNAVLANPQSQRQQGQRAEEQQVGLARCPKGQFERTGGSGITNPWAVEPDLGRVAHGVPNRVDRLRCLGNAIVPQVAELVGRRVIEIHDQLVKG